MLVVVLDSGCVYSQMDFDDKLIYIFGIRLRPMDRKKRTETKLGTIIRRKTCDEKKAKLAKNHHSNLKNINQKKELG